MTEITEDDIRYSQQNDKEIGLYIIESKLPKSKPNSTKDLDLKRLICFAINNEQQILEVLEQYPRLIIESTLKSERITQLQEEVRQLRFRIADEQDSHTHVECHSDIQKFAEALAKTNTELEDAKLTNQALKAENEELKETNTKLRRECPKCDGNLWVDEMNHTILCDRNVNGHVFVWDNELKLKQLEVDGIGSMLLDVQKDCGKLQQENQQLLEIKKRLEELPNFIEQQQEVVRRATCSDYEKTLIIGNLYTVAAHIQSILGEKK